MSCRGPYALSLIGHCHRSTKVRVFRADCIVGVALLQEGSAPPDDFDPKRFVSDSHVFFPRKGVEAPVRYSAQIALWPEEQGPVERQHYGSVMAHHPVAGPSWLARHVLGDVLGAEVPRRTEIRERVAAASRRILSPAARPQRADG